MGFFFPGTSRFKCPPRFKFRGRLVNLDVPHEATLNWVFRDVILDDEYGLQKLRTVPRTVLDVGANVGMFSLWAGLNFPAAIIHSYEPNANLRTFLDKNLSQVGAKIFAEGVGGVDGLGNFSQSGESMVGQCKVGEAGEIVVVSLQTAIERMGGAVDLLKLDCEGAEWSILDRPEVFAAVACVRMEYHLTRGGGTVERLVADFRQMGFHPVRLEHNRGFGLAWFDRTSGDV